MNDPPPGDESTRRGRVPASADGTLVDREGAEATEATGSRAAREPVAEAVEATRSEAASAERTEADSPDEAESPGVEPTVHVERTRTLPASTFAEEGGLASTAVYSTVVGGPAFGGAFPPLPSETYGRFKVLSRLGAGTFGTVYKAYDPTLDRVVALKIPRQGGLSGSSGGDRFGREARAAARLRHPGIVPVYELGEFDGTPFIVSEFIDGTDLAAWSDEQAIDPRKAARITAEAADALHFAHDQGVVHRDVKPTNILIDRDGRPHVLDFGLAKRDAGEATVTLDGDILGTPAYMSPEQVESAHEADGRSDVYSLGVVLYRLLTGELPFRGNARMVLHQIPREEPKAPRSLNDRVPRDLETVCLKAMAKERHRRYATAADLAADLRRWLAGEPVHARPLGPAGRAWRWVRRHPAPAASGIVAASALVVIAGASIVIAVGASRAAREQAELTRRQIELTGRQAEEARFQAEEAGRERARRERSEVEAARTALGRGSGLLEEGQAALGLLWIARALALAPEGRPDLEREIRPRLAAALARAPRLDTAERPFAGRVESMALAPDGRRAVLGGEDGVARLWDVQAARTVGPRLEHDRPEVPAVGFAAEGRLAFSAGYDGVVRFWDAETGHVGRPSWAAGQAISSAELSGDGRRLVIGATAIARDYSRPLVQVWDMASGAARGLNLPPGLLPESDGCQVTRVTFTPDGAHVLATFSFWGPDRSLTAFSHFFDADTGEAVGRRMPHNDGSAWAFGAAIHPGGRLAATAGNDSTVRFWEVPTGEPLGLIATGDAACVIVFHPDGRSMAFGTALGSIGVADVATRESRFSPLRHARRCDVKRLTYTGGGRHLLSSGTDGSVTLWDAEEGRAIAGPLAHPVNLTDHRASSEPPIAIVLERDGSILTGDAFGVIRRWRMPEAAGSTIAPDPWDGPREEAERFAQAATNMALDADGNGRVLSYDEWRARSIGRPAAPQDRRGDGPPSSASNAEGT